jgi:hypothetical protein
MKMMESVYLLLFVNNKNRVFPNKKKYENIFSHFARTYFVFALIYFQKIK